ncbi:MAG: NUDIX domain-containing protein [Actinomycetota bacterium]|nr:NUDIX domain-containing protein [Actinomycetota bacterium]
MSFIRCGDHTHWGPYGAAGLFLTTPAHERVLLQLRSAHVLSPGVWALPGGALERGESVQAAAVREAEEEVGLDGSALTLLGTRPGLTHPRWSYTYVLAQVPEEVLPRHESWEASEHRWFDVDDVPRMHPTLASDWSRVVTSLG